MVNRDGRHTTRWSRLSSLAVVPFLGVSDSQYETVPLEEVTAIRKCVVAVKRHHTLGFDKWEKTKQS